MDKIIDLLLTVSTERALYLHSDKLDIRSKECGKLDLQPLQEWTIKTLIGWLQNNRLNRDDEIKLLGAHLYQALLDNKAGELLHQHRNKEDEFLRIELLFNNPQDEISGWPWEYLYRRTPGEQNDGYFIANEARFAIVRCPAAVDPSRSIEVKDETVRVLFVAASPCDFERIEFGGLQEEIKELQWVERKPDRGQRFELLEPLVTPYVEKDDIETQSKADAKATWDNFKATLEDLAKKRRAPHVIHFIGHGMCSGGVGQIAFVEPNYSHRWITGEELATVLKADNLKSVRLVFLQACESATQTRDPCAPYPALSSVARTLAGATIPAVVAMQSRIVVETANQFAEAFYNSLVQMMPVYQAVQKGRQKLKAGALGIPVLYLIRRQNEVGVIFPTPGQHKDVRPPRGPASISGEPAASSRIVCAWCGRLSARGRQCSFECAAVLKCPNCSTWVKARTELKLSDEERYQCTKCLVRFLKTGQFVKTRGTDDFKPKAASGNESRFAIASRSLEQSESQRIAPESTDQALRNLKIGPPARI